MQVTETVYFEVYIYMVQGMEMIDGAAFARNITLGGHRTTQNNASPRVKICDLQ